jgi:cob(I)alamin adenosyltransferase
MSITTKQGDNGTTSLYGGARVWKDDIRIEICGLIDEICSFLGLAKSALKNKELKKNIHRTQHDLFVVCSEIATPADKRRRLKKIITASAIRRTEQSIRMFEHAHIKKMKGFCTPGSNFVAGLFDVCRSLTRTVERRMVTLARKRLLTNNELPVYMNRLSDLLYIIARQCDTRSV